MFRLINETIGRLILARRGFLGGPLMIQYTICGGGASTLDPLDEFSMVLGRVTCEQVKYPRIENFDVDFSN